MKEDIPLTKLILDAEFYIRQNVNERHVDDMVHSLEGNQTLPPIVVWQKSKAARYIIVDGVHRYHAYGRHKNGSTIPADVRHYSNREEAFRDAVLLNTAHGLKLDTYDELKVIEIGKSLGLKDLDLVGLLRTSLSHLRTLEHRFATIAEAKEGVTEQRKVALKSSVRHLAGTQITVAQEKAMGSAPGQSYLLTVDQLISAIRYKLLPPRDQHEALWERLAELNTLLGKLVK